MTARAVAAAGAVAGAVLMFGAAPVLAASGAPAGAGTGAGVGVWPVCTSTPMHPGGTYPADAGGTTLAAVNGVQITNTGSGAESLSLAVVPVLRGLPLYGLGHAVPPSWVSFRYPRLLWILPQHSVRLGAGASATVPVSVSVPAGAPAGVYVAELEASAAGGSGPGFSLGAGAMTPLLFTVGTARPPAAILAHSGSCWQPGPPWWDLPGPAPGHPGWSWYAPHETWTYTPGHGHSAAAGQPPGWQPGRVSQVWVGCARGQGPAGWQFYTAAAWDDSEAYCTYTPPGGSLPVWARPSAAGDALPTGGRAPVPAVATADRLPDHIRVSGGEVLAAFGVFAVLGLLWLLFRRR